MSSLKAMTLAAVSLAGNILQFLSFTGAAISKTRQIYASTSGTLKEHDDLEGITTDLKDLASRLQTSTEPVDSVLEQLCSSCSEVADELLKSLKYLGVKGKLKRSESFRKALKALWGKEKLRSLEERLAGFRQELILHVTVDLRSQIDLLSLQQNESFQPLDNATKESVQKFSEILNGTRDHLVTATDGQTKQLKELHKQTETILSQEFESAGANLAEQSETTRTLTAKEQQRTRTVVLNAVADAASENGDAISAEAKNISARIQEANESTRAQFIEVNQEINGIQRGLRQLQLEINRKTEELKEIIIKVNTTREGPHRNLLREKGNSATVVLMSLHELYKALEEMLKPLRRQTRTVFDTLFGLRINHSPVEDRAIVELERVRVGIEGDPSPSIEALLSLPVYSDIRISEETDRQRAEYEEQKSKARADAGQSGDKGKKAVDPERRPDVSAIGRLSDPEPRSPWKVTVSQILKMYDNPTPLHEPQISDGATSHDWSSSSSSRRASIRGSSSGGNVSPFRSDDVTPPQTLRGQYLEKQAASLNVQSLARKSGVDE